VPSSFPKARPRRAAGVVAGAALGGAALAEVADSARAESVLPRQPLAPSRQSRAAAMPRRLAAEAVAVAFQQHLLPTSRRIAGFCSI
jgi:hypothetical protein